jgi:hypothetical protein
MIKNTVTNIEINYSAAELSEYLSKPSKPTPISDCFGDRENLFRCYPAENLHEVQKEHITTWFKSKDTMPAKNVYNRLRDPAMFLWIAESIGIDIKLIKKANDDAGGKYMCKDFAEKCGKKGSSLSSYQAKIIKGYLPWEIIYNAINK